MIESDVVTAIETVPDLSGKVYPLFVPKSETLPFCVYASSGTTETDALGGWIGSYDTSIEVNLLHESYKGMKNLALAVTNAIKAISTASVSIEENQPEIYEPEIGAYRKVINLKLTY